MDREELISKLKRIDEEVFFSGKVAGVMRSTGRDGCSEPFV